MVMRKRVGIRDVARAAEVSTTTVSHALNGQGRVKNETRERIERLAKELGYTPSALGVQLVTGHSMMIAVQFGGIDTGIIPSSEYFIELLNAAADEALSRGYTVIVLPSAMAPESVASADFEGGIVVDPTGSEMLLQLDGVPVITTGRAPTGKAVNYVDHDMSVGTRLILDHIAEAGSERPALLASHLGYSFESDVIDGYVDWMEKRGSKPIIEEITGLPTEGASTVAALRLLRRKKDRPDAILTIQDRPAIGVLEAARSLGIDLPNDMLLASVTDSPLLRVSSAQVTALEIDAARAGREAVRLLVGLIENGQVKKEVRVVPARLVPRATTRRPAPASG